jgi:hypothetical protein
VRGALAIVLAALALAACGADEPDARGTVIERQAGDRLLVRAAGDDCGDAWGHDAQTEVVVRGPLGDERSIPWSAVEPGASVEVWADGDVAASCPGAGRAERLVVLAGP